MKKTNNKGFSLVELIIVIAIMAILAGAIAPALIRYIDKSRKSNDVSSCKTIKTAVETAMSNEEVYETLTGIAGSSATPVTVATVTPGSSGAVTIDSSAQLPSDATMTIAEMQTEIQTNIGEKMPRIKYKKDGASSFLIKCTGKGTISVFITDGTTEWQICPDIDKKYQ